MEQKVHMRLRIDETIVLALHSIRNLMDKVLLAIRKVEL